MLELPQPVLILQSEFSVRVHQCLIEAQPRRAPPPVRVELAAIEISITRVEHPAIFAPNCDARMARRMARQRYHENFGGKPIKRAGIIKTEPAFTAIGISAPVAHSVPLRRAVAAARNEPLTLALCSV